MLKISNAFSLQMLEGNAKLSCRQMTVEYVMRKLQAAEFKSYIGHKDIAAVVSDATGVEVPANRESLTLTDDDVLLVAQYKGPRLPEGTTKLPEGASIEFWKVTLI